MDIRVAAYNPTTATSSASRSSNPLSGAYTQSLSNSAPVTPVAAARPLQDAVTTSIANNGEGYTDSVRGSLINILA
ncbi:MAG: hypothetical protein EON60_01270 [Alphaproteobacteria bacterium]|nr:MAG: hypothetical protein EON60_01270 [Alphaproteobacteria bacterium]